MHTFCIGVWPCNNLFVTLMGGHLCQDLMEQTICSTGGSFEVRSEYIITMSDTVDAEFSWEFNFCGQALPT